MLYRPIASIILHYIVCAFECPYACIIDRLIGLYKSIASLASLRLQPPVPVSFQWAIIIDRPMLLNALRKACTFHTELTCWIF